MLHGMSGLEFACSHNYKLYTASINFIYRINLFVDLVWIHSRIVQFLFSSASLHLGPIGMHSLPSLRTCVSMQKEDSDKLRVNLQYSQPSLVLDAILTRLYVYMYVMLKGFLAPCLCSFMPAVPHPHVEHPITL